MQNQSCYADPDARPHLFLHTGDQIYADDVASILLHMLDDAGKALFNWVEDLGSLPSAILPDPDPQLYPTLDPDPLSALTFASETTEAPLPEDPSFKFDRDANYSIQPGQRLKTVQKLAGFSLDVAGDSHLMRFSEYACMYLFAWSDVLWPTNTNNLFPFDGDAYNRLSKDDFPSFEEVLPWAVQRKSETLGGGVTVEVTVGDENDKRESFEDERNHIFKFRGRLSNARRVLANVPSYMMCDDHEVTDDWFISNRWTKRVYSTALGCRILQNGMSAFALFQGWGNKPADFIGANTLGSALLTQFGTLANEHGSQQSTWQAIRSKIMPALRTSTTQEQGNINGIPTTELDASNTLYYDFRILFSNFALLAINSRTERGLPQYTVPRLGPALLHPEALRRQVKQQVNNLPSNILVTLVICPAPVIGHAIVEGFLQTKLQRGLDNYIAERATGSNLSPLPPGLMPPTFQPFTVPNPYRRLPLPVDYLQPIASLSDEGDREGWSFHPECMQSLLKELSVCKKVILFSGDVHYGFSVAVNYERPANNSTPGYPEHASFTQLVCSSMKNAALKTLAAGSASSVVMPLEAHYAGWNTPGLHYIDWHYSILGSTLDFPLLPRQGNFHFLELTYPSLQIIDPPQWRYDIHFAKDNRSAADRFNYSSSGVSSGYNPPSNVLLKRLYDMQYERHLLMQNIAIGRTQIGQVRLNLNTNKVYHNFWFKIPTQQDAAPPGPITKHELDIASV
ncbi:hypothetical protein IC235_20405 [Hymenobacter sp. BT664]|uniref:PhoD-like phosphatase metallophosphatase domain-containing protein n=1 Tax=Hymenobacter montanus TaxID=2771359 RepID=A0A927BG42_9BACT|nr:hypothetical protein [Hymenobacter montanus]